jgi:RNA-splicing ligase RtcB
MILRKGAVSARWGENLVIPINMRDGSLLCRGKGNPEWNFSAPHGAGRIMGRREAKRRLELNEFKQTMEGIYSTSVSADTIDESPMVYKPMTEIVANIQDTVEVLDIIMPVYNFKAGGE